MGTAHSALPLSAVLPWTGQLSSRCHSNSDYSCHTAPPPSAHPNATNIWGHGDSGTSIRRERAAGLSDGKAASPGWQSRKGKSTGPGSFLGLLFCSHVTLDKGLHNSEPQFPHSQSRASPSTITAGPGIRDNEMKGVWVRMTGTAHGTCLLLPHTEGSSTLDLEIWIGVHQGDTREGIFGADRVAHTRTGGTGRETPPGMWKACLLSQALGALCDKLLSTFQNSPDQSPQALPAPRKGPHSPAHTSNHQAPSQGCYPPPLPAAAHCPAWDAQPDKDSPFSRAHLAGTPACLCPPLAWPGVAHFLTTLPPSPASRIHWVLHVAGTQCGITNQKREVS